MENIYYCNIFLPPFANIDPLYFINNVVPVNENLYRASCSEVFCEEAVLKNLAKFTGKHQCQSLAT